MKKIKLEIKSLSRETLLKYKLFVIKFLNLQNLKISSIMMPNKNKKISLLKSPHVNKRAQSQFEMERYKLVISINTYFYKEKLKIIFQKILLNKPKLVVVKVTINS